MIVGVALQPWMAWLLGAMAGSALAGIVVFWYRNRGFRITPEMKLTISPMSGGSAGTAQGKGFMPPPAAVASSPTSAQDEQRTAYRRAGNPILIQVADQDGQAKPFQAWVLDRSRLGLRLAIDQQLPIGGLFGVRATNAPPSAPWCPVEIRHCGAIDDHWEAGCRFLLPPPVHVLMTFG